MAWTTEDVAYLRMAIVEEGCEAIARVLNQRSAEVAREAAERGWDEGAEAMNQDSFRDGGRKWNPYRKPERPVSAEVLAAMPEVPPFPTIRKENSDD